MIKSTKVMTPAQKEKRRFCTHAVGMIGIALGAAFFVGLYCSCAILGHGKATTPSTRTELCEVVTVAGEVVELVGAESGRMYTDTGYAFVGEQYHVIFDTKRTPEIDDDEIINWGEDFEAAVK